MQNRSKLVLAGLTATLALGAFVSASSANRLGLKGGTQGGRVWRATWNNLKFLETATIECRVTIEGSFHSRTISKVLEALIGYVTRVTVDSTNCGGGSARALTETLPWHVRYGGFTGTLPAITTLLFRVVGARFLTQVKEGTCLYASEVSNPMKLIVNIGAGGVVESLRPEEPTSIPWSSGNVGAFSCKQLRLEGNTTSLTEEATTTKITLSLVA